jgi:hypothetical protein
MIEEAVRDIRRPQEPKSYKASAGRKRWHRRRVPQATEPMTLAPAVHLRKAPHNTCDDPSARDNEPWTGWHNQPFNKDGDCGDLVLENF